jgi:hypothetical protein
VKIFIATALGVIFGFVGGYWLHGEMAPPLGSKVSEHRVLTSDLSLEEMYFFKPSTAPVFGTIRKGSKVAVAWHKSSAAYIEIETVVPYEDLARISSRVSAE